MKKSRHYIHLKRAEISFNLWRLREEEYRKLRQSSLPIKEDSLFIVCLFLSERDNPDRLTLPKAFLALERLFGESNLILYGHREGDLFEEDFESAEVYRQAIAAFEKAYRSRKVEDPSREIQLLLQRITDD